MPRCQLQLPRMALEFVEALDGGGGRGDEQGQAVVALKSPELEDLHAATKRQLQLTRTVLKIAEGVDPGGCHALGGRGEERRQAPVALESPVAWYSFLSNDDVTALSVVSRDVSAIALALYISNCRKVAAAEDNEEEDEEGGCSESECGFVCFDSSDFSES